MKTIFVKAIEIPDGPEIREAMLGDAGFVVLLTRCPACGHSGDCAIEVAQIDGGEFRPAPTVADGVTRLAPEVEPDDS